MAFQFDLMVTGITLEQANDISELFMNWVGLAGGRVQPGLAWLDAMPAEGLQIDQLVIGLERSLVELILDGVIQLAEVYGGQAESPGPYGVGGGFAEVSNEQPDSSR